MGGEHGPEVFLKAIAQALTKHPDMIPILVGDETIIAPILAKHPTLKDVRIVHTPDVIAGDEKAVTALRTGKKSSMRLAINLVNTGEADAVLSGGNTGALMAMALIVLRTVNGIDRPALASYMPTLRGQCCVLDLGANIECSTDHLVQFALMGDAFCRVTSQIKSPSIGLINVGEEEQKGGETIRDASTILMNPKNGLNYHGFIEGNDVSTGLVDVVVVDGFAGNIMLKAIEGTAKHISIMLRDSFRSSLLAKMGYALAYFALKTLRGKLDPQKYNGAVLLGLNGIVVKSHGNSAQKGIYNAIMMTVDMINNQFIDDLKTSLQRSVATMDKAEDGN